MRILLKRFFFITILVICMFTPLTLFAESGSAGTEFFLAFQVSELDRWVTSRNLYLQVTGKQDTRGTISIPGLNYTQAFNVQADQVTTITIPNAAQYLGTNTISKLGVHVLAEKAVSIYGVNTASDVVGDAFLALPVSALGNEYIAISKKGAWFAWSPSMTTPPALAVVGAYDNTLVRITPAANAVGHPAKVPFTITLNRGETYQINGENERPYGYDSKRICTSFSYDCWLHFSV